MLLDELLDDAPSDLPVQVEVKAHGDPELARATAAAVCRVAGTRQDRGRVEVLSFHTMACEETARHGMPARLVAWADYAPAALARWAARAGVGGVCIEHFLLHRALVERLRSGGLSVTTGTVNDAALAARAAALGVDAITTDRPAALHRELAAMSSWRREHDGEGVDRTARSAGRSKQREDPRVAVDLQLVDDLDVEADDPRQSPQTLRLRSPSRRSHRARIRRPAREPRSRARRRPDASRTSRARSRRPAPARPRAPAATRPVQSPDAGSRNTTRRRNARRARARSSASMRRYSTRDPISPAIARKPTPPSRVTPKRACTQSTYCSLSTATTRRAPRTSARKL